MVVGVVMMDGVVGSKGNGVIVVVVMEWEWCLVLMLPCK